MKVSDLQLLETRLTKSLTETVVLTVNGKMDRMQKALDEHITKHDERWDEVLPIVEAYQAGKAVGNFAKWARDVFIALAGLAVVFKSLL